MKTDLFQSCSHCWVFQICWHVECNTLTASFRIWDSSIGIPSPPLALFIVMLPKAHLTSHSRMSGSRWVITPSWLSGSWRSFLYGSSVYACRLLHNCLKKQSQLVNKAWNRVLYQIAHFLTSRWGVTSPSLASCLFNLLAWIFEFTFLRNQYYLWLFSSYISIHFLKSEIIQDFKWLWQ